MKSFFESFFSDAPLKPLALATVRRGSRPPSYLAADPDQTKAKTNTAAVRLHAEPETVRAAIQDIALHDLEATERSYGGNLLFICRSPMLRLPDGLHVWIDCVDKQSRVALFSRSRYAGHVDFGVNAQRVKYVIQELKKRCSS